MFAMFVRMGREERRGGRKVLKKRKGPQKKAQEREREREIRMLLDLGDLDKRYLKLG